jgi:predicted 3-demethylubiquinone-9 3-methyltransferase (glyoxalase superfamily)
VLVIDRWEVAMVSVRAHLWFHDNGYAAATFYEQAIPGTRITNVTPAPEGVPGTPAGSLFVVELDLAGVPFTFLSAGPSLTLDDAFSVLLSVDGQDEVDHYWEVLTADGGQPGPCGWLRDRFGVSWQVVPRRLGEIMSGPDVAGAARATAAMLAMGKLDVAALEAAYAG